MILGRVAEWFMASVLKTEDVQASGGSNPLPSVKQHIMKNGQRP